MFFSCWTNIVPIKV